MRIVMIAFAGIIFFSCKNSIQDKPLTAKEFLKLYKPLNTQANIADSGLKNFGDTSTIAYTTFTRFVPDSALENVLNNEANKYSIHPAGIIHTKTFDYLLVKFTLAKTSKLAVFVLDDKQQYKAALLLLDNNKKDNYTYSVSITTEPAFITRQDKTGMNKEDLYSRYGYAFSASANAFTAILNDSNEDEKKQNEIINPIDTFATLNKYSADYVTDKQNFISVRDGKNQHTYLFFIHFEKSKGSCIGELKGQMNLTDATNAVYQESGDPCVIRFKFSAGNIKIKEEGNCGNYRGITCPFDFNFKRKKQAK